MADVSDPTDFAAPTLPPSIPTTLSQPLSSIDALLRCRVCKDFFTTPMITNCSHTFCSICIRRCLSAEGKCPVCRANEQEVRLRRNWAVEEMVEGWRDGRQNVLEGLKALGVGASDAATVNGGEDAGRQTKKRRKLNNTDAERPEEVSSRRSTRSKSRRALMNSQDDDIDYQPTSQGVETVEDSEGGSSFDGDFQPAAPRRPSTRNPQSAPPPPQDDGLVPCPVCGTRMKEESVFAHLDRCNGEPASNPSPPLGPAVAPPSRPSSGPKMIGVHYPTRKSSPPKDIEIVSSLPTINYNLLNEKNLRRKLKDLGIPDWGPKPLLQRRHTEWINLWNANCDARRPRTKRELLQELDTWERTLGGNAPAAGSSNGGAGGMFGAARTVGNEAGATAGVGEKDFDTMEWSRSHQDDFKELIRKAREKQGSSAKAGPSVTTEAPSTAAEKLGTPPTLSAQGKGRAANGHVGSAFADTEAEHDLLQTQQQSSDQNPPPSKFIYEKRSSQEDTKYAFT